MHPPIHIVAPKIDESEDSVVVEFIGKYTLHVLYLMRQNTLK